MRLLWLFAVPLLAQHAHDSSGEKPPALLAGLGKHTYKISTANTEAQKFFDQGFNLLYGFNRYEAWRSFRKAAELDPKAVMPRWGMAMATGPHINMDMEGDVDFKKHCAVFDDSAGLTGAPVERALYDAARARCPNGNDTAYIEAMRRLAAQFPDNLDVQTFYAEALMIPPRWRWFSKDGKPAEGVDAAIRVLETVMRRNLDHPGANHLYIHAVESSPTPERAIPSAQRLMGIVPAAGHLVHMPAHIWMTTGDWEAAANVNERAAEVDREYMKLTGVTGSTYVGYYIHNLTFVAFARQMQGRFAPAFKAANEVAAAVLPFQDAMPAMTDVFLPYPWFALERFRRWNEILALKPPDAKLAGSTAFYHWMRALALRATGRATDAAAERAGFTGARSKVPADMLWGNSRAADIFSLAGHILDARFAATAAEAVQHLQRAVEMQDRLTYNEPPDWHYPVRESLGAALLRAGRATEAEAIFREGIRQTPRNGRMLFGLRESLKAQSKTEAAALVDRELNEAWRGSDVTLRMEDF